MGSMRLRAVGRAFGGAGLIALAVMGQAAVAAQAPDAAPVEGDNSNAIVVTAAGYEQNIVEAPASITVLGREELQEKRFGSLAEALQDVQGVDVGGEAGKTGGLNISIRGMPSDYTLVLIDGRRQNAPGGVTPNGFGETSTSFLPPFSAIDRIEVVRGPMSTLYGSDAMGGVVNIITRKVGMRWVGTATAESTIQGDDRFGNIQSVNGFAQGPIIRDLLGLTLRGSVFHREGSNIDIPGDPALTLGRNPVRSDVYNYGGRLSLTPHADHDLWVEYDRNEQSYDNSEGQLGTLGSGGYAPEQRFNRSNYVIAHSWRMGFGQLDTTLTRNETETIGRLIPNGTPGATPGAPRTLEARNDILDSRFAGKVGALAFTVGGQYWKARMVEGVAPEPFKFTQWAGFAEATLTVVDGFNITGGARYDNHSTFGDKWSPRVYGVWNINEALTLKGGVSRGFKTPRVEQIAEGIIGFGSQGRVPLLGSPGLTPETSTSYEAGLYYDGQGLFSGNVTLFNNDFTDKIASGPGVPNCRFASAPNLPGCVDVGNFPNVDVFSQSINIDKARTRGVEVATRFAFTPALSLSANYTYTETEQLSGSEEGLPLIGMPKHMLNGNLRWKLGDKASVWARAEVRSSRYRGANVQQTAVGDFRSYEVFHLGGSYQLTPAFRLAATVYNVVDTDYAIYVPYRTAANATAYTPAYSINQEGRRLWLSATVDF
ncbi:TonB-dependent receptor [Sphingobium limneticum]|jgi:outer membrane receptor for ferrienterochelin and colicins|uniref:TonB-dependent receptor domain-containing protein n=2 Tax=Sphingomonadaceae TaxID=41297 RepID=UPI000DBAF02D|nr:MULTISPECIES: TonB-dependent receptor [Sphingobium]KAA9019132.1 TonB-dependent receptor [Sphingobium limneticum]MBU0932873.1 TonB-dependent receptor [Alphaproteobacteria bacterium]BBC98799.1 outer membrane receptor for ferrienterochelin and colicins [Sphingobium sp. YG1]